MSKIPLTLTDQVRVARLILAAMDSRTSPKDRELAIRVADTLINRSNADQIEIGAPAYFNAEELL